MHARFFIARKGSTVFSAFSEDYKQRNTARIALQAFLKDIGAESIYGTSPASYCFDFETKPDQGIWRRHVNGRQWVVRKRGANAKAMQERIDALPPAPGVQDCLRALGPCLWPNAFLVSDGRLMHRPHLRFYTMREPDPLLVLEIPWRDVDPEKRAEYDKRHDEGNAWSMDMDYLSWVPSADLEEIKEWEALKLIDERDVKEK